MADKREKLEGIVVELQKLRFVVKVGAGLFRHLAGQGV